MRRVFASLTLVAALVFAPIALHADPLMVGQFSIQGTATNSGNTLSFDPLSLKTGTGTQTGSFLTLLPDGLGFSGGTTTINYNPYTPDSAFFFIGSMTISLDTLNEMTSGSTLNFSGVANLAAAGFANTLANYTFSTQASGASQFVATAIVPTAPSVPEPSTLVLFGSGALALAGLAARKFRTARA